MKNLIVKILILVCLASVVFAFTACDDKTDFDQKKEEGNIITVTYNPNGGKFFSSENTSLIDMFNPSKITPKEDGKIHIKLTDPLSSSRPGPKITLVYNYMFNIGWYKTRKTTEVVIENEEYVLDVDGNALDKNASGKYFIKYYVNSEGGFTEATGDEVSGYPAYTYEDLWNFDTDELIYEPGSGEYDLELYAAWLPFYKFEFYFEEEGANGNTVWTKKDEISFDYVTATSGEAAYTEKSSVYLPYWSLNENDQPTGALNYQKPKDNATGQVYNAFPKISGTTFAAAYADKDCTQPYTNKITHLGSVDYTNGTAVNPVQKVYVKTTVGETIYIDTVDQFVSTSNLVLSGIYHIRNDLAFTADKKWPTMFTTGTFAGKMIAEKAGGVKFTGIDVSVNSKNGGVFGSLASTAELNGITFENVTVSLKTKGMNISEGHYGLLAGQVASGAKFQNVSINGSLKIEGETIIKTGSKGNSKINVLANGVDYTTHEGITKGEIKLVLYGYYSEGNNEYRYKIDNTSFKVDAQTGDVVFDTLLRVDESAKNTEEFVIGTY